MQKNMTLKHGYLRREITGKLPHAVMIQSFSQEDLNIKYKDGDKKGFVHTMNSTACAVGRMLMAIIENYQDENGNIWFLKSWFLYAGGMKIIKKKN